MGWKKGPPPAQHNPVLRSGRESYYVRLGVEYGVRSRYYMSFSWGCGLFRAIHAGSAHPSCCHLPADMRSWTHGICYAGIRRSHWIVPFIFLSFEYRSSRTEHGDCIHSVPNSRYIRSILLCLMTLFIETGDLVGNQASQGLDPFDPQGFPQRREGCGWGNATQIILHTM